MTYTPSSAIDFIEHFEAGNLNAANPFYYESSSDTINFGYGINLTAAENAALAGDDTLQKMLTTIIDYMKSRNQATNIGTHTVQ